VYNLVAISVDRYIAIIKPLNYHMLITKFRARVIIAFVWISSFIVCSPSFLLASSERKSYIEQQMAKNGTKSAHEFVLHNPESCRCTPSNSGMYYILFSASSSFYIPMIIVIFVYARIYLAAMAATKSQYAGMVQVCISLSYQTFLVLQYLQLLIFSGGGKCKQKTAIRKASK
jgi:hypothetical protein